MQGTASTLAQEDMMLTANIRGTKLQPRSLWLTLPRDRKGKTEMRQVSIYTILAKNELYLLKEVTVDKFKREREEELGSTTGKTA